MNTKPMTTTEPMPTHVSSRVNLAIVAIIGTLLLIVGLFIATSKNLFTERAGGLAELGGDFTLQSAQGQVSLSDFRGKVVVMYFGFLSCPEVCPNSMGVIAQALQQLNEHEIDNTQALLVSIDPQRDTLDELARHARFYHPKLMGLTGEQPTITEITKQYGAYYNFDDIQQANEAYAIEHSSRYYVINQTGDLVAAMRHSTTANELRAQIQTLLANELKQG